VKKQFVSVVVVILLLSVTILVFFTNQHTVQSVSPINTPTPINDMSYQEESSEPKDLAIETPLPTMEFYLSPGIDKKDAVTIIVQTEVGLEYYYVAPDMYEEAIQTIKKDLKIFAIVPPQSLMQYIPKPNSIPLGDDSFTDFPLSEGVPIKTVEP
jgi:hypothetical protein